ncbi:MAG: nucleotidyltransferase family protein [Burkholderiales bacterium]
MIAAPASAANHGFRAGAEIEYLCALIRSAVAGESAVLRRPGIDWARMAECLRSHHMLLPMIRSMLDLAAAPAQVAASIRETERHCRLRTLLLLGELARVLPPLVAGGCEPIVLKGPALARTVYGNRMRCFTDIDFLVAPDRRGRSLAILAELGYTFDPHATAPPATYDRHHFHYCLLGASGVLIELHWDLSEPLDYVRMAAHAWPARSRHAAIGEVAMQIPGPVDHLLLVAKQALDTSFADLRRIVDAAMLIRAGAADEPGVARSACAAGLATPLWILLRASRSIAGVAAPALESALAPPLVVRACLVSLDIERQALTLAPYRRSGLAWLIRLLGAPDVAAARREFVRYLFPAGWSWAALGFDPDRRPALTARMRIFCKRLISVAKAGAYQIWRLARYAAVRGGPKAS